jgi:hypothetical protein
VLTFAAGMAFGRVVSAIVDTRTAFYPNWFYCLVEAVGSAALFAAARPTSARQSLKSAEMAALVLPGRDAVDTVRLAPGRSTLMRWRKRRTHRAAI